MPVNSNGPGPPPRTGSWVVWNRKTWETAGKKEKGRQGCDTTGMGTGSQNSWAGFLAAPHILGQQCDPRIIELERNLLIMYLI